MRRFLNKTVCYLLGHLDVSIDTLPPFTRRSILTFDKHVESTCLRCYRHVHSWAADFFTDSPLMTKLKQQKGDGE